MPQKTVKQQKTKNETLYQKESQMKYVLEITLKDKL